MNRSETISNLAKALVAAQQEMRNPMMDSTNPHFRSTYVSLAGVRDAVIPVLAKHGLAVTQMLNTVERGVICETILLHESGEWMSSTLEMPAVKFDAQGLGSAATYARRYALMAIACVVGDEDDDGNQAVSRQQTQAVSQASQASQAQRTTPKELHKILESATNGQELVSAWRTVVGYFPQFPEAVEALTAKKDEMKAKMLQAA